MNMRSYIEESNFFKGINPEEIAQKYGTPVYVYNEENIREHMRDVANVITKYPYRANYSMKANSNLTILKMALEEGLNADAMSEGEMRLLIKAGFPSDRIFFVPNNVDKSELQFAIDHDIMVSLDSLDQLDLFGQLNPGGKCSVRINPGVGAGHHEKVVTAGKKTKFGVALQLDITDTFDIPVVVFGIVGSWTQFTVFPGTHSDGTTRVEATHERHVVGVAVGNTAAHQLTADKPSFFAQFVILPEVNVTAQVLGIADAQQLMVVILGGDHRGIVKEREKTATGLQVGPEIDVVALVENALCVIDQRIATAEN